MPSPEALIIETLFRIADKDGEDVDFVLNSAQRKIDEAATTRNLVPKARQEGVSSYILARFLAACLMYRNTRAVIVSHDTESTQRLLRRAVYCIDNIRGPKPILKNKSANELTFPKMNSSFWIGTAGSRKFGRGDTISHLHCSEYAYWPNPTELMRGLLQAVPTKTGEIWIESTGNGYNDYHRRCMRAAQGKSIWTVHFLSWLDFDEYKMDLTDKEKGILESNLREEWEEPELLAQGVSLEQIAWRRVKLDEMDYDVSSFKQEYPRTLDECFQMSSQSVFHEVNYIPTEKWKKEAPGIYTLKGHPQQGCTYVLGGDVAGGVGRDSSTIEVFCLDTCEQVAEYISDRIDPEAFAFKVRDFGLRFNKAYCVVEQNNHGILTLSKLRDIYPSGRVYSDIMSVATPQEKQLFKLGFRTTKRTKPLMIGRLRTKLAHEWTIHSELLKDQLSTFIEHENGSLAAQDGCDDDLVIGAACAALGESRAALVARPQLSPQNLKKTDPFLFDNIIEELHSRDTEFPISPQHKLN